MSSSAAAQSGFTANDLMQAAMHAHDRELHDLRSAHKIELEILHHELAALRQEKAFLEQQVTNKDECALAIEDAPDSGMDTSKPTPASLEPALEEASLESQSKDGASKEGASKDGEHHIQSQLQLNHHLTRELHNFRSNVQNVPQHSMLRRFVDGKLDDIMYVAIFLNSIYIFIQLQFVGYDNAAKAGLLDVTSPDEGVQTWLLIIEHVFNAAFILELTFRMAVYGRYFFFSEITRRVEVLNLIDLAIVVLTSIDSYVLPSGIGGGTMNLTVFRSLRFLRLAKIARVGLAIKIFYKLKVLLATVACSMLALFWSIVLIFGCLLVISLVANQLVAISLQDTSISLERREWMYTMYGTSTRAYWTLFELTFSGGWPSYARPLIEEVSSLWAIFFVLHIVVVQFAMFRIVSALFLRDTLALAANDAETAVQEKLRVQQEVGDKLLAFFNEADTSGNGRLSREEFSVMLEDPKVRAWLSLLDLDVRDAMQAFTLMQQATGHESGEIEADDFVKGMMRMKGPARSQDVLAIWHMEQRLTKDVARMSTAFHLLEAALKEEHAMLKDEGTMKI